MARVTPRPPPVLRSPTPRHDLYGGETARLLYFGRRCGFPPRYCGSGRYRLHLINRFSQALASYRVRPP